MAAPIAWSSQVVRSSNARMTCSEVSANDARSASQATGVTSWTVQLVSQSTCSGCPSA